MNRWTDLQPNGPTLEELELYKERAKWYKQLSFYVLVLYGLLAIVVIPCILLVMSYTRQYFGQRVVNAGFSLLLLPFTIIMGGVLSYVPLCFVALLLAPIVKLFSYRQMAVLANAAIVVGVVALILCPIIHLYVFTEPNFQHNITVTFIGPIMGVLGLWLIALPNHTVGEAYRKAYHTIKAQQVVPTVNAPKKGQAPIQSQQQSSSPPRPSPLFATDRAHRASTSTQRIPKALTLDSSDQFDEFYREVLKPQLDKLDGQRKFSNISRLLANCLTWPAAALISPLALMSLRVFSTNLLPYFDLDHPDLIKFFFGWLVSIIIVLTPHVYYERSSVSVPKILPNIFIATAVIATISGATMLLYGPHGYGATISLMQGTTLFSVGMISYSCYSELKAKEYLLRYKQTLIPQLLKYLGVDLTYSAQPKQTVKTISNKQLIRKPHSVEAEDMLTGSLNGVSYKISELSAKRTNGKSAYTVFDGLWYEATFPKAFEGWIKIYPESSMLIDSRPFSGTLTAIGFKNFESQDRVTIDDREFNLCFRVYGGTPDAVKAILTPKLRADLIATHHATNKVSLDISGNTVTAAISIKRDFFMPMAWTPAADQQTVRIMLYDIQTMLSTINAFDVQQN